MLSPMILGRLIQALAIEPGDAVLDVACGLGYSSAVLAELGARVIALEADETLAAAARERLASVGSDAVDGRRPGRSIGAARPRRPTMRSWSTAPSRSGPRAAGAARRGRAPRLRPRPRPLRPRRRSTCAPAKPSASAASSMPPHRSLPPIPGRAGSSSSERCRHGCRFFAAPALNRRALRRGRIVDSLPHRYCPALSARGRLEG